MAEGQQRALPMRILRALGRLLVTIAVVIYTLLDELLSPLFGPLIRKLTELRLFQRIGEFIGGLPPYGALALLGVPFVIIEPAKAFAVYWAAIGHVAQGTVMLLIAHVLSLLICERIFHAGYVPLMRIGWFNRLLTWLFGLRDKALDLVRETNAWKSAATWVRGIRAWARGVLGSLR